MYTQIEMKRRPRPEDKRRGQPTAGDTLRREPYRQPVVPCYCPSTNRSPIFQVLLGSIKPLINQ